MTAPIVLFVFARPDHTRRTLEALTANELADQSDLIVYADAGKDEKNLEQLKAVKELVYGATGFKSVTILERDINYGLARNIIEGVTEVCNKYGRVIVLEDDIVTSPNFLTFMNTTLDKYAEEKKVWHISGWNYPIDIDGLEDVFLWRAMNCWGWATWADRWQHFEKKPEKLVRNWTRKKIKRFNLDNSCDFWEQVKANYSGKLNTWAIFWYATIFEQNGLCLNPVNSFVENIGHDGSGENCGKTEIFFKNQFITSVENYPEDIQESLQAIRKIRQFHKRTHLGPKNLVSYFVRRVMY